MRIWALRAAWIVVVIIAALIVANYGLYAEKPFNKNQWASGDARQRGRMVADLRNSQVLMDKTQLQVIERLGPPDRMLSGSIWQYEFIHGSLFNVAYSDWVQWMEIEFDSGNRVSDVTLND